MTSRDDKDETTTHAELRFETCREEPRLDPEHEAYDATAGLDEELLVLTDFGASDEVSTSGDNEHYLADTLPTMWVKRPKDKGDTYAITPLLVSLKMPLL